MQLNNDSRIVMTLDAGGTNLVFSAIRANQEIVAPKRSSRRIAALIAQIATDGTIPAQTEVLRGPLRAVASL